MTGHTNERSLSRVPLRPLVLGWLLAVAGGFAALMLYANTPGPTGATRFAVEPTPGSDPERSAWRLVIGVHPRCPCTGATIANLGLFDPQFRDRVAVEALVYTPATAPEGWRETGTFRALRSAAGVAITPDLDGHSSERHGIQTSGGVVLYDPSGAPRFHGGITPSRGHEGPCAGVEAIRAIVAGRSPDVITTPTFGCLIRTEELSEP